MYVRACMHVCMHTTTSEGRYIGKRQRLPVTFHSLRQNVCEAVLKDMHIVSDVISLRMRRRKGGGKYRMKKSLHSTLGLERAEALVDNTPDDLQRGKNRVSGREREGNEERKTERKKERERERKRKKERKKERERERERERGREREREK